MPPSTTRKSSSKRQSAAVTWTVYVVRCNDDSLYTGIARDVAARIAAHDEGRGARYTRGRGPLQLCATRVCVSQGDALRLELAVKRLSRVEKEALLTRGALARFARRHGFELPKPKAKRSARP